MFVALVVALWPAQVALSHGGRLNSEGCHNNRKTGDYHCHGGGSGGGRSSSYKLSIKAIPRAYVYINGEYIGPSPTKTVKLNRGRVDIKLVHPIRGEHKTDYRMSPGEDTTLNLRW